MTNPNPLILHTELNPAPDPNLLDTLSAYDGTVDFLRDLAMDDDALTKAIIGTMGDLDSYQLPDAKGYSALSRHVNLRTNACIPVQVGGTGWWGGRWGGSKACLQWCGTLVCCCLPGTPNPGQRYRA